MLYEVITKISYKITRVGQLVGVTASERLGVPFGIVDLSLAPTPAVGDSVAHILEEIGLEACGTHGTTATLALLNRITSYNVCYTKLLRETPADYFATFDFSDLFSDEKYNVKGKILV